MRPIRRSISPRPDSAAISSSRGIVFCTMLSTAPLRRRIAVTDSMGFSSQPRSRRAPMGVFVLSSTHNRLPRRSRLRMVAVSSRFCRAVQSSSMKTFCS